MSETEERAPHLFARALDRCPECGSDRLVPVIDDDEVHFLCEQCDRCWHVELNYVTRVDPRSCAHCEYYTRCAPTFARDHTSNLSE